MKDLKEPRLFSQMTNEQLDAVINRGGFARSFLEGDFYKETILPAVELEMEVASKDSDWRPGKVCEPNAIALVNCYNSGKKEGLNLLLVVMSRLSKDGEEAVKEKKRRKEKEEKKKGGWK